MTCLSLEVAAPGQLGRQVPYSFGGQSTWDIDPASPATRGLSLPSPPSACVLPSGAVSGEALCSCSLVLCRDMEFPGGGTVSRGKWPSRAHCLHEPGPGKDSLRQMAFPSKLRSFSTTMTCLPSGTGSVQRLTWQPLMSYLHVTRRTGDSHRTE